MNYYCFTWDLVMHIIYSCDNNYRTGTLEYLRMHSQSTAECSLMKAVLDSGNVLVIDSLTFQGEEWGLENQDWWKFRNAGLLCTFMPLSNGTLRIEIWRCGAWRRSLSVEDLIQCYLIKVNGALGKQHRVRNQTYSGFVPSQLPVYVQTVLALHIS